MRRLLARANRGVLARFARANVLLAFDFDGTLCPIVRDRGGARMRRRTRALLASVCERYPCAVISGRGRDDVAARLDGVPVRHVVGNHGLEPHEHMRRFEAVTRRLRPALEAALRAHRGVEVEDKRYSLSVHYRKSRQRGAAREAIDAALAGLREPVRAVPGKLVVSVLPAGAPHKGDALLDLRRRAGADAAVYVGDDVTDEDVFELDDPERLLCVRVGASRASAAPYYLKDQREIDLLLDALARLRAG